MNKILKFLPRNIAEENTVNPSRFYNTNHLDETSGKTIYLVTKAFRAEDNFAFNYCFNKDKNFEIIFLIPQFDLKQKQFFFETQMEFVKKTVEKLKINYHILTKPDELSEFLNTEKTGHLIKDFNPLEDIKLPENKFRITEIDNHNICPVRFISDKQEYNAATLRRKIYNNIAEFITEYPPLNHFENEAERTLKNFIEEHLPQYAEFKNNPVHDVTSGLSKYLNWGFISGQRVFLEVLKSSAPDINKEVFFEELVIRQSLSDNFCLYCKNFKSFDCIPNWAKETLNTHLQDIRTHIYTLEELEEAATGDELWNASQNQLKAEGKIHGYMRMYWAKKIFEWTSSPQKALEYGIYMNDKYAFDAPSTNGYTGILWSIGGLHDRPFADYPVTGKIRRMTYNGAKSKFDINKYIKKYI